VGDHLHAALDAMDPTDREVLALRHFEGLTNAEAAAALGLSVSAASKRYVRAVERLRLILTDPSASTPGPGG
jgi:RNA polymerase sigma-70 factor (ECF subfamily)